MSDLYITGMPGVGTERLAAFKRIFRGTPDFWLSGGRQIDGVNSRDPTNTGNVNVLQPGVVMGMITSSRLYAPAIIGLSGGALTATGTSLTIPAAVSTELARRVGATGTFTLTGPPVASGTVRSQTVTYSVLGATTATITALGVNCVQTLVLAGSPSGSFTLTFIDYLGVEQNVGPIAFNSTAGTMQSNTTTAIALIASLSGIVATCGTAASTGATIVFTYSGSNYANMPQPLATFSSAALTAGYGGLTMTTAGVDGRFVTSSIIAPTDGSQTPLTFIGETDGGVLVTDVFGSNITVPFHRLPVGGEVDAAQMVNWPADSSLQTWLMQSLSTASGGKFVFGEMFF